MKEFGKLFSRRYSAVCVNDDVACSQLQSMVTPGFGLGTRPDVDPAVVSAAQVALQRIQRRKSLTTNRSMKPIDILGSFFYEPSHGKRNRVPTRAFLLLAIGFLAIATATLVKVFDPYNLIFKWAISHLTATQPFLVRMALKTLLVSTKSEPIVRTTAKEFMFGYPSALATLGNTFLPNWIPFEKVGLIDRMYDFSTDFETFYTGVPNPALSGLYATYRGETNLPQWEGNHCSNIEFASDGTKFKSFMQSNETVKFFRKSMCRPINLYRVGEEKTYGRLKGYSYVFEDNAFDNGETNKANKCFCRKGDCQPVGLIDVTDCYYGFPISLSFPHFMNGDLGLQENITGVNPDPTKHSSAFVIQPESGLPLSLSVKMQINMHFKDLSNFPTVSKFSYLTTPMLWFEIMMTKLPDYLDSRFNFYLNILPLVNPLGFWIGLLLGISLLGYAITRATLHISNNACRAANISKGKYGIENLNQEHRCGATNPVYSPCEMKLLGKLPAVNRNVLERSVQNSKLCTMNPKPTYALDMEPALLDACESTDVVQNCNNITPSRKSTTSHQKVVLYHDDDDKQIEFFSDNPIVSNF
ncbi:scavenger receptor class B member 1 isoform X2 [Drosophila biarmipes]|uniref:scavenger receptor class B member 1 isoform X2 n=1 Tax=Drosophila biarmipes TaxID=125945 RepID=UPI0021CC8062|nr:scavenger receptor class B member 1 isoform X2 [Drosophila biarmipes]